MKKEIEYANSFDAVYDGNARVLMMGTIPSSGGVKYGFFYMSKVNHFYEYLQKTLQTDNFVKLAKDYRAHYNTPESEMYKERVKRALYRNKIALFDVINNCERTGSADVEITKSENNSADSVKKILYDNPNIKMIFVNSQEVEKRLKKIFGGSFKPLQEIMHVDYKPVTRVLSPSPFCKMTHTEEEILQTWKPIRSFVFPEKSNKHEEMVK